MTDANTNAVEEVVEDVTLFKSASNNSFYPVYFNADIASYAAARAYAGPVQAFPAAGSHYVFGAG